MPVDMKKLAQAHQEELWEAGLAPNLAVLPERLAQARAEYLHLLSKSRFLTGLAARLGGTGISPAVLARVREEALREQCRAEGACFMLDTLGVRLDIRA